MAAPSIRLARHTVSIATRKLAVRAAVRVEKRQPDRTGVGWPGTNPRLDRGNCAIKSLIARLPSGRAQGEARCEKADAGTGTVNRTSLHSVIDQGTATLPPSLEKGCKQPAPVLSSCKAV